MKNKCDVWFLYSGYTYEQKMESGYIDKLREKAKDYGITMDVKNTHKFVVVSGEKNELYYDGKRVEIEELPKYAIVRRYEIYLGRALEMLGVKVLNNVQAMIDSRNKLKTHQMLAASGVPSPKTVYVVPMKCLKNVTYDKVVERLGSNKFILKWVYGSQGTHVHLVDNEEMFNELIERYEGKVLCQEFIESSFGMT